MPEKSNAPANPSDEGRATNYAPKQTFYPLNDRSEENNRRLIERIKAEINPLCDDN
jgi:hypothetical protein